MNNEVKNLIERLRNAEAEDLLQSTLVEEAADLLERIYSQPVELPFSPYLYTEWASESERRCSTMYTADQLTKAVHEATARALEAAAMECEARYMGDNNREDVEAKRCASAIRNLIGRVK